MDGVSETLQRNLMSLQEQDVENVASTAIWSSFGSLLLVFWLKKKMWILIICVSETEQCFEDPLTMVQVSLKIQG